MTQTITVSEGQTILDVAVQKLGDASRMFEVAAANNINGTDDIAANDVLKLPGDADISKQFIVNDFVDKMILPASVDYNAATADAGIDFWIVEQNLIVQ